MIKISPSLFQSDPEKGEEREMPQLSIQGGLFSIKLKR